MRLLFYLPFIIWTGLIEVARGEMRPAVDFDPTRESNTHQVVKAAR